ncbi:MAG: tRNA (guanosine(46)-N7)-methyltransferase TrmB [Pseudomonadota bacterium]
MTGNFPLRTVRSFVRRQGRKSVPQQEALARLWPQFGVEMNGAALDFDALFNRRAARILEIGFGMGTTLAEMAATAPERDFLGIEVHRPGIGNLLLEIEQRGLDNIRIINGDAVEILQHHVPDETFDGVMLFFPDPWPKTRHHKRRIVQPSFVDLLARKIKSGGTFHMATDWEHYAQHMMKVMSERTDFANAHGTGNYAPRPEYRPLTKFEQRGLRLGHGVWDLIFTRA